LNKLKLGSLFDGIGGFPLSAQRHGIEPVWASEIEPFPIKVTQHHFPNMKHLGDITQINGAEIEPVDIITFGSPCQDLSVAGKREGLEGARSGLFMDAARIIREMRTATRGQCPRFAVWENVPGAFSSNRCQDFRAVLEEIMEAEIPMPYSGKWATSGMVRGNGRSLAWRVLDAQYFGVPQRRKRIFLVADFTGQCAGEILFEQEGLRGDFAESRKARQEAAATVGDGVEKPNCLTPWDCQSKRIYGLNSKWPTLYSGEGGGAKNQAVLIETAPTLRINCTPEGITGAVSSKWAKGTGEPAGDECYNLVIEPRSPDGVCRVYDDRIVPMLNTAQGGQRQPCVITSQPIPIHDKATRYKGGGPTRKNDGAANGFGVGKPGDVMPTLGTGDRHAVAYTPSSYGAYEEGCVTLRANGGDLGGGSESLVASYAVRRLTPLECERLMGFPDGWTDIPGASDTARYKSLGNSVARPCVDFVMSRIAEVLRTK
jgi:DNA (cytosine-5)-methyltransferase 1